MQPNSDLLAAAINLGAAIVSLVAVLIGIAYSIVSRLGKKDRPRVVSISFQVGIISLLIAGALAYSIFGAEKFGLSFYIPAAILISLDYIRGPVPAQRVETLMLILSWVSTSFLLIVSLMQRLTQQITILIGVVERLVH